MSTIFIYTIINSTKETKLYRKQGFYIILCVLLYSNKFCKNYLFLLKEVDNMSKTEQSSVNKLFQNIVNLYEQHNYSSALKLIEEHRDSMSDSLNMKDQLQLNKLHASSAYHEIIRLHEENPDSTELKNMLSNYQQMLEIHLNAKEWNHLLSIFSDIDGKNVSFNSTDNLKPKKRVLSSNLLLSIVFILFLVGILALAFLFLKPKLSNTNTPAVPQSSDTKNGESDSNDNNADSTTNDNTAQNSATAPVNTNNTVQNPTVAPVNMNNTVQNPAAAPVNSNNTVQNPTNANNAQNNDYLLPSDTKILTKEDMATFDKTNINLAINEMFARYGYDFGKSGQYYEYFKTKSWYQIDPKILSAAQAEDKFSEIEHKNLNFLLKYKKGKIK